MRRSIILVLAASLALAGGTDAWAHAHLKRANPRVGSTVPAAPEKLQLWFSEGLEPAFSTIELRKASGERVETAKAAVAADDPKRLELALPKLAPGAYKVIWHAVSVDTHVTDGDFGFTVAQ